MRHVIRWWETLGRPERIVTISIGLAAPVLSVNSAVWAIAVCYIVHQKALVEIERLRAKATDGGTSEQPSDAWRPAASTPTAVNAAGHAH